jgi:hypothetical protein
LKSQPALFDARAGYEETGFPTVPPARIQAWCDVRVNTLRRALAFAPMIEQIAKTRETKTTERQTRWLSETSVAGEATGSDDAERTNNPPASTGDEFKEIKTDEPVR